MISIISSNINAHKLDELRALFISQWGKFDPFEKVISGIVIPGPVLALSGDTLIGGLSFTVYPGPENNEKALWINGLFVDPNYRGLGIASKLIKEAEGLCKEQSELFVYTEFPGLYEKSLWERVETSEGHVVLKKELSH